MARWQSSASLSGLGFTVELQVRLSPPHCLGLCPVSFLPRSYRLQAETLAPTSACLPLCLCTQSPSALGGFELPVASHTGGLVEELSREERPAGLSSRLLAARQISQMYPVFRSWLGPAHRG